MTLAVGSECYALGENPCSGKGISWTQDELDDAMSDPVAAVVFDDEGKADIGDLLATVADTEFKHEELERILEPPQEVENWRVGEALAECYLVKHRDCYFPWPDGRDERKEGSSLPGADLVGFQPDAKGDRFTFGEVKTSQQDKYPPQAMYGPTGLKKQLVDLRDNRKIRDGLMKYLGHRAKGASWQGRYQSASKRYLANSSDISLYGVLVRDVAPHKDDVRVCVEELAEDRPDGTEIELLGLYLPDGQISELANKALSAIDGGAS